MGRGARPRLVAHVFVREASAGRSSCSARPCAGRRRRAATTTRQRRTPSTIEPSSYVVRDIGDDDVVTAPVDTTPTADGRSPVEQTYTVKAVTTRRQIAVLYDIDLDELRNYNGWAADYSDFPAVGGIVRIPPDAQFIDPNATTTSTEEGEDEETDRRRRREPTTRTTATAGTVRRRGRRQPDADRREVRRHPRGADGGQRLGLGLLELPGRRRQHHHPRRGLLTAFTFCP